MKSLLLLLSKVSVMIMTSCEKEDENLKTYTLIVTVDNQTSDYVIVNSESVLYTTSSDHEHYREKVTYIKGVSTHTYSYNSTLPIQTLWYVTDPFIGIPGFLDSKPGIFAGYGHCSTTHNDSVAFTVCYR